MKKRIQSYMNRVDTLIRDSSDDTDWLAILDKHRQQISFYQHERLVHLLVTALVAILAMLSIGIMLIAEYFYMFAIGLLLLALLIPYICHYFFLENAVQKMYQQYDEILEWAKKKKEV